MSTLTQNNSACVRCKSAFSCKPQDIGSCDCNKISLTKEEYDHIHSQYTDCLCNNCLGELKQQFHAEKTGTGGAVIALFIALCLGASGLQAQYAPGVGLAGTTAMNKDSSAFVGWATGCRVTRGYQDISSQSQGFASAGDSSLTWGKAQSNGVLSLGDRGTAVCTFAFPIKNGPGADFAVFENSFDDSFLELALVEVSSDGINFTRFKAHSLTDTVNQTGTFGYTDPVKLNNLAGKYRGGYGTPFDLQELAGTPGLNVSAITHVKIIDVVGSLNKAYVTYDGFGNKINDPWPTAFPSGGFDLDAIGVINQDAIVGVKENLLSGNARIYPNPVEQDGTLKIINAGTVSSMQLVNSLGQVVAECEGHEIRLTGLEPGYYFLKAFSNKESVIKQVLIRSGK